MGQLVLPATGLFYLDASIIIYSIEKIEPYFTLLQPLWQGVQANQFRLIGSELLIIETLVKPLQKQNLLLENAFHEFLTNSTEFRMMPITLRTIEQATRLRAQLGLKTPDAIHAATALDNACNLLLTNDAVFKRVSGLPVIMLEDVLAS